MSKKSQLGNQENIGLQEQDPSKKKHILDHRYKRFRVEDSGIEVRDVEFITFDDLIKKYLIKSIDKLQIDVEGSEYKIMKSIDFNKVKIEKIFVH